MALFRPRETASSALSVPRWSAACAKARLKNDAGSLNGGGTVVLERIGSNGPGCRLAHPSARSVRRIARHQITRWKVVVVDIVVVAAATSPRC
jgi:hypothetical protein